LLAVLLLPVMLSMPCTWSAKAHHLLLLHLICEHLKTTGDLNVGK
jgi:hypothetical protein